MNEFNKAIGFIGAGNMASSIISGLINKGLKETNIFSSCPNIDALDALNKKLGINVSTDNKEVVINSKIIVLSVKPNKIEQVLNEIHEEVKKNNPLIISVATGIKINSLEALSPSDSRIIRAMPNTPSSVNRGITAICGNKNTTEEDKNASELIFKSIGITLNLDEGKFDLFTSLLGSGPAYVFYFIESLIEASNELDISKKDQRSLILQLFDGSTHLARTSDKDISALRKEVTSPGGVTEEAIAYMENHKLSKKIIDSIKKGEKKAKKLGENK